jgi:hypothetical protein
MAGVLKKWHAALKANQRFNAAQCSQGAADRQNAVAVNLLRMPANSITALDENAVICHLGPPAVSMDYPSACQRGKVASLFWD